ncbi:sarcolemmal membrane-associated protein [Cydia fagiglandana]|uniref:sarcolemmal membrane-associated protein n=1 Tax=Cydia fagiglandana TaxID=1458189 RepID=UPI002FEE3050
MVIAKRKVKKPVYNTSTIKNMDYNWAPGPEPPNNQEIGVPKAVFVPHSNSLPFEERRVTLEQPVKIGRNVYRATPSPTNTIFECRVLSRHHATLYYDKGHFYLVDNQSSNGTFINNNRCSISKEQEPHEVFSGDVVQFGIPVVENATNSEKNTFPPVVALLKLFHPDGKEAKLSFNPTMTTPLHLKELYQLNNFVQEAIQREASLEGRLRALRECVQRTQAEARASWELFVGEQRLLMRVHTLETMLAAGKQPEAAHVAQLLHDKKNYQEVATESLRAAHEQRLALEETLERRGRETAALLEHNAALRLAAKNATAELQKLAARCERKMCAARLAIAAAEERELAARNQLPLAYSVQNGEAKMLVLSTDSNKLAEAKRTGTLEDAVRALPDYIKMLLPQHLLNKVGIKAISAEGKSAKEFELILKKNNIYDEENKEKDEVSDGSTGEDGGSGEEKTGEPDLCTDDEKQQRLNHEPDRDGSSSPLDGELRADNNANSTYTEPETEDSPSKGGVEYANILRVMAGLNEEIRALRERLGAAGAEAEQLRAARDELLAARADPDPPHADHDDLRHAHAKIDDLQAQLKRSTAVEEANLAEIQRLASSAAWMQAELAFRPTRAYVDDLTADVAALRADLQARDAALDRLSAQHDADPPRDLPARPTADKAVETDREVEGDDPADATKISADIDEMFRLDYDDDETESVATEIDTATPEETVAEPAATDHLLEEERLAGQLANGSLHALQEELVRAKESWAEVCAERARLATQLAELQHKPRLPGPHLLAVVLPLLAAALYWLLPYLS